MSQIVLGKPRAIRISQNKPAMTDFLEYIARCPSSLARIRETQFPRSCDTVQKRASVNPCELYPVSPGPQRLHPRWTPTNHEFPASFCPSLRCSCSKYGGTPELQGLGISTCLQTPYCPPRFKTWGKLQGSVHPPCYGSSSVAPAHLPLVKLSGPQHLHLENGTAGVPTFRVIVRSSERKHASEKPGTVYTT